MPPSRGHTRAMIEHRGCTTSLKALNVTFLSAAVTDWKNGGQKLQAAGKGLPAGKCH